MPKITILTPTWNRRHLLTRLYESLQSQNVDLDAVEWLVVDDGSTDGTGGLIEKFAQNASFNVRLFRQENAGKCSALNLGVAHAKGEWLSIIDSDDILLPDALEKMLKMIERHTDPQVAVIFCLYKQVMDIQGEFSDGENWSKFYQWMNSRTLFDTPQLFRTEVLKKHPFPIVTGETYMAESWVFHQIDRNYMSAFENVSVVHAEYQQDGLSSQSLRLRSENPVSAMRVYRSQIDSPVSTALKFRAATNFWRFFFHAKRKQKDCEAPILSIYTPCILSGFVLFLNDQRHLRAMP